MAESITPQSNETAGGASSSRIELALLLLSLASIGCWLALYRWYSLFKNRSNTHFAFEKIDGQFDSPIIRRTLALFVAIAVIYAIGYYLIRRAAQLSQLMKLAIVVSIAGPAFINIILYPVGALDVFNYMIEIKLRYHYGINPYLQTFEQFRTDSYALPAFLVTTKLFYGPVWLLVSWLPGAVVGYTDVINSLLAMKTLNLALLLAVGVAIWQYHESSKARWLSVYVFLANPLILFEGLANAHNDVMMTAFLIVAWVMLQRKSRWSGAFLAASALVKFFTAVLAPLFIVIAIRQRWGWRKIAVTLGLTGLVTVAASAPFWAGGDMVDGLREGSTASQAMYHVSVYSLAQQYERERENDELVRNSRIVYSPAYLQARTLSPEMKTKLEWIFGGLFVATALLVLATALRGRAFELIAIDTMMLFCLLLTNLYGWYLIPIFAVLALRRTNLGTVYLMLATLLGLAYYPAYVYGHFNTGWDKFHVHLFLAIFLTVPMIGYLATELGLGVYRMVVRAPASASIPLEETTIAPARTRVPSS